MGMMGMMVFKYEHCPALAVTAGPVNHLAAIKLSLNWC